MASLESLPADQKAVLSLVLQRDKSFDQIAALLFIDRAAVRKRALDAFDSLGPDTSVHALKRGLITDYLLGQLPPALADGVHSSLSDNPPERAWARVIAAEIASLATDSLPEIPAASAPPPSAARALAPGAEETFEDGRGADRSGAAETAGSSPRISRRGGAALLALMAVVVTAVVIVLLLTGGSSSGKKTPKATAAIAPAQPSTTTATGTTGSSTQVKALHQINLVSPSSTQGREGAADVVRTRGNLGLVLVAEGLEANTNNAYGVWLYNSTNDSSDFLGFYNYKVPATGKSKGELEAEQKLPADATTFNELLLTLETAAKPTKPGAIVLEGSFAE